METWKVSDRVFAYSDTDDYFYPAEIVEIEDEDIRVRFDSGQVEWTSVEYLEDYAVQEGEEVECISNSDDEYHDVTVLARQGDRVQVEYEDGTTEWTSHDRLRFFVDEL